MQQTRTPAATNTMRPALQPPPVLKRRTVTAAAAAQSSGMKYQGVLCTSRHSGRLVVDKRTTLGGPQLLSRGDQVVARFREGESGAAADASSAQEGPEEDDTLLCGQPGFELCAPGPMDTVPVVLALGKHCQFGHSFGLVGETPELGAWDTSKVLHMEWNEGDVWQANALIPVSTPVAFKCVELGPDGNFVGWIQDIAAGGNMTVLAEPAEGFVSGYQVTLDPPMSAETGRTQPYLTARLDVVAMLPMSAAFYERKKLAVAAGMPAAEAEDLLTDKALAEQGLMSEDKLAEKWPAEIRDLALVADSASDTEGSSLLEQDSSSAAAGAVMGAAPDVEGGVAAGLGDAASLADAVAAGIIEAGEDETVAVGDESIGPHRATPASEAKPAEEQHGPHVKITVDQGSSVSMRGEDPLSLPDVPEVAALRGAQAPGGFVDSGTAVGPYEGLLVPAELAPGTTNSSSSSSSTGPRVKITVDQPMSISMRGEDPLSLPDMPEVSAIRGAQAPGGFVDSGTAVGEDEGLLVPPELTAPKGFADVQTPSGAQHEAEGVGSHEQLLAPPEQAQAAGLTAQAEGLDEPTATMSADDQLAAALAAAAAAASTVRYAGGTAAARVEEAKEAVDERNKLLDGAEATPVDQVMAEAGVIAAAAKAEAEFQGVQEVADVVREAAREKAEQHQNPGEAGGRGVSSGSSIDRAPLQSWGGDSEHVRGSRRSGRGGWLKRLFTGQQ